MSCALQLCRHQFPAAAIANYRWIGEPPLALQQLTWIEEQLIARAHISGMIYRLERKSNCSYLGVKGHIVIYPQDTRALLDILPLPPSRLPEMIRVVWTGKSSPSYAELHTQLSIRTLNVYNALRWLCQNNEDYKSVTIDYAEFATWPPVYIVEGLIKSMGHISENVAEQIARCGPATEEVDDVSVDGIGDTISTSGILDSNNVSLANNAIILRRLASLMDSDIIKVIYGSQLLSNWDNPAYFTAAFPTLFPYGIGKHMEARRIRPLSLKEWSHVLIKHCSR